jgi:hypothetical protein
VVRTCGLIVAAVAAAVVVAAAAAQIKTHHETRAAAPPRGLSVYGETLWNLEALLHDTFGTKRKPMRVCLRWRDDAFVSGSSCGALNQYGYWQDTFVGARHSRFKLVRRANPPAIGNVGIVTVNGLYVSCDVPGWGALAGAGSRTRRWLVVVHGWAMTPFMCVGQ